MSLFLVQLPMDIIGEQIDSHLVVTALRHNKVGKTLARLDKRQMCIRDSS